MQKKDDIIRENEFLKFKLQQAEIWMGRQIHESVRTIQIERSRKASRKKFENLLETDITDSISDRIDGYFWSSIEHAPVYTRERLLDSEIYWMTLQKHPTVDAFPIVASYQKILDAFFEEHITAWFRSKYSTSWSNELPMKWLEMDIASLLRKNYTLSLGRWYQFLKNIRQNESNNYYSLLLAWFIQKEYLDFFSILLSDNFYCRFEALIEMEVFGRKRHDKKISYTDAKRVREILVGNYEEVWLLKMLF